MKFSNKLIFLTIHLLSIIKSSDMHKYKPELSQQRNLQSKNSENIYDIYITGYSFYKYYINLFFNSEPQIPDNLNIILLITIDTYIYSKIYDRKEINLKAEISDINKLTAELDKTDLLDAYVDSNLLFITIKNVIIEPSDNNIYNIHLIDISFNIIPFYFEENEDLQVNTTIIEEKTNISTTEEIETDLSIIEESVNSIEEENEIWTDKPILDPWPSNIILNKIHIIGYDIIDNQLNLYTYFENATNDDIYFLIKLNIDSFNIIGNYWQREEINIITINNLKKNKYTSFFENLNINELNTHTKITIIEINAKSYYEKTLYYVDTSQITFDIRPSRKPELDMTNLVKINQIVYNIYFTEIYHDDNKIHLVTYSEPETIDNMHYLVSFDLDQFNSSESNWERKKFILNTTNNINDANEFILDLDDLNLENYSIIITITNIKEEQSDENNIYYIHFPIKSFNIENLTQKKDTLDNIIYFDTDIETTGNSSNNPHSTNKTSSSRLPKGVLYCIIIIGIIIVLSAIIIIVIKCFFKKIHKNKKIADFPSPNQNRNKIDNSLTILNDTNDSKIMKLLGINVRVFKIQTQKGETITIKIEKNKTMKDLRKLYFEKINRIDLFEDKEIYFLCDGRSFTIESNEIIETIFKNHT